MALDTQWPPKSPRHAMLGSPSGRRKLQDITLSKPHLSPTKRSMGSPSLLERLRATRQDREQDSREEYTGSSMDADLDIDVDMVDEEEEDEDEDEETLQLKLAAIEAKLKLKRLQQNKAKQGSMSQKNTVRQKDTFQRQHIDPAALQNNLVKPRLEVPLSPTRKAVEPILQRSPGRVLLGIDKGLRAADVSLKRARTIGGSPTKNTAYSRTQDGRDRREFSGQTSSLRSGSGSSIRQRSPVKSFSDRMAEMRQKDQSSQERHNSLKQTRSTSFQIDHGEMDKLKTATEVHTAPTFIRPRSPIKSGTLDRSDTSSSINSGSLSKARTLPESHQSPSRFTRGSSPTKPTNLEAPAEDIRNDKNKLDDEKGDASLFEGFSGIHLSSRILPHSFLKRTLPSDTFTIWRIQDLLKNVTSPAFEIPDEVGDYVVFGIVASKSSPLDHKSRPNEDNTKASNEWEKKWDDGSQNRKKFMVFTLTDLKWTVDLFLFDTAVPRYHRLSPGTVVAILNPNIMPPKRGKTDTGAFSLQLQDGDDQVLEIGKSKHLGFCNAVKKDSKECGSWVDASKTEICEWHLNAQIAKAQARRMGVNTGPNGYSKNSLFTGGGGGRGSGGFTEGGGSRRISNGRGYDQGTDSHFFISGSTRPTANSNFNRHGSGSGRGSITHFTTDRSIARLIDGDGDDDPFIAEGEVSRERAERMRKRGQAMQKEWAIAEQLAELGSGSSRAGAGADYMKKRLDVKGGDVRNTDPARSKTSALTNTNASATSFREELLLTNKKRAADSIRLGPVKKMVKKTRFVTDRGIKEAGRESVGTGGVSNTIGADVDIKATSMARSRSRSRSRDSSCNDNHEDDDNNDHDDDDDDDLDIV